MKAIRTGHLFAPLHEELMSLLRSLSSEEWSAPTTAGAWTVKDVAAHLLDTALRRLSMQRDGHFLAPPTGPLGEFINRANREWVEVARRLSPPILTEMHETYGRQLCAFLESLDPFGPAIFSVSWAGEDESQTWFDVARELTERWHHQQQIRDAAGRPPLYDDRFFQPVIETFVRALPFTYRSVDPPDGTSVVLRVTDEGTGEWSLVRSGAAWVMQDGAVTAPTTTVSMRGDIAWRLFTKGLKREQVVADVEGEPRYAEPLLNMISIVA